jgi:hypothetical protein
MTRKEKDARLRHNNVLVSSRLDPLKSDAAGIELAKLSCEFSGSRSGSGANHDKARAWNLAQNQFPNGNQIVKALLRVKPAHKDCIVWNRSADALACLESAIANGIDPVVGDMNLVHRDTVSFGCRGH